LFRPSPIVFVAAGAIVKTEARWQDFDRISYKWMWVVALCLSPIGILGAYLFDANIGIGIWSATLMLAVIVKVRKDIRTKVWFWGVMALVIILQIGLVSLVPWSNEEMRFVNRLVFLLNAVLPFACLEITEWLIRLFSRNS
jgi:hypothetical protein